MTTGNFAVFVCPTALCKAASYQAFRGQVFAVSALGYALCEQAMKPVSEFFGAASASTMVSNNSNIDHFEYFEYY